MKKRFSQRDYQRALGDVVFNKEVIGIFGEIFSEYPPEILARMSQETLELLISKLLQRDNVKNIHPILEEEIKDGERTLEQIAHRTFSRLQESRTVPKDKKRVYYKRYQEVWAYCNTFNTIIAKGLFSPSLPLEQIKSGFIPENTFYTELSQAFSNGKLMCEHGDKDVRLERVASAYVYRDSATDEELTRKVKKVMQKTANRYYGNSIKSEVARYKSMEDAVINNILYHTFSSLRSEDEINYTKVYKIFEAIMRENIEIGQLIADPELNSILEEEIENTIPLPYAVIRTRVKQKERKSLKLIQALYNIRSPGQKELEKKFKDLYGLRAVVPTIDDVLKLVNSLRSIVEWEIIEEEDLITHPRPSGYKAYHTIVRIGETSYELQIMTHQMDRDAEKDPNQKHDGSYIEKTKKAINKVVPWQVMRLVERVI